MALSVAMVYGSVRSERQGIRAVRFLEHRLAQRGIHTTVVDPLEYRLPLLDKMFKEYSPGEAPEAMRAIGDIFETADGFIIVTGEYNHSVPPALKNILDHFQREYLFKPSAIACYSAGRFGGMRAAVHMRSLVGELGMPSISSMLSFPKIQDTIDTDGTPLVDSFQKSSARFLDEFIWYMDALKKKRAEGIPF